MLDCDCAAENRENAAINVRTARIRFVTRYCLLVCASDDNGPSTRMRAHGQRFASKDAGFSGLARQGMPRDLAECFQQLLRLALGNEALGIGRHVERHPGKFRENNYGDVREKLLQLHSDLLGVQSAGQAVVERYDIDVARFRILDAVATNQGRQSLEAATLDDPRVQLQVRRIIVNHHHSWWRRQEHPAMGILSQKLVARDESASGRRVQVRPAGELLLNDPRKVSDARTASQRWSRLVYSSRNCSRNWR